MSSQNICQINGYPSCHYCFFLVKITVVTMVLVPPLCLKPLLTMVESTTSKQREKEENETLDFLIMIYWKLYNTK